MKKILASIIGCLLLLFSGVEIGLNIPHENCNNFSNYSSSCFKSQALGRNVYLHLCMIEGRPLVDIRLFKDLKPSCDGVLLELIQFELITRYNKVYNGTYVK